MSLTISIKKFRDTIDNVKDPRDSVLLKLGYLGAYRACELCRNVSPSEMLSNSSKPYGVFLKWEMKDFVAKRATETEDAVVEKALVLTSAVAKRGKRIRKRKVEDDNETDVLQSYTNDDLLMAFKKFEQMDLLDQAMSNEIEINPELIKVLLGRMHFKVVSLPVATRYEPWTLDLLKHIQKIKSKSLSFAIGRKHFWHLTRKHLSSILPKKDKRNRRNPLRHYRLSHLVEFYQFAPFDLTLYSGWTAATAFSQIGIRASGNIDSYIHLRWHSFFPKLLKPLKDLY